MSVTAIIFALGGTIVVLNLAKIVASIIIAMNAKK